MGDRVIIHDSVPAILTRRLSGNQPGLAPASVLLLGGAMLLQGFSDLSNPRAVGPFLGAAAMMCFGFLLALRSRGMSMLWFWAIALIARMILLRAAPGDDMYRYIWEGEIQNSGFCPYCFSPDAPALAPLRDQFWQLVKHKDVAAIYPPLAELTFRMVAAASASIIAMKLVFVAADLLTCRILALRFGPSAAAVYAWNPLVLYAFAGGGHYDSLFVLTLALACFLWERDESPGRRIGAAASLGASVALKWLCLPVLGWAFWKILRRDGLKRFALASCAAAAPFGLSWTLTAAGHWNCPLIPGDFARVARSAEALPALLELMLPREHVLNKNTALLWIFAAVSLILLWRQGSIQRTGHAVLAAAFLITPMFHAWYATWILPLGIESRRVSSVALSMSAFVYFWLHHTVGQPGGIWRQTFLEKALLWGPFLAGLVWDGWRQRRANPSR